MIFKILLLVFGLVAGAESCECVDGTHNVITVDSFGEENLSVTVDNVTLHVYDIDMKPSCHNGKVNVVMPGFFVIKSGEVRTNKNIWAIEEAMVSVTIIWSGKKLCVDGKSSFFAVPDNFCVFHLNSMMPEKVIEVLQKGGVHTIEELTKETGFNATMEIPESPSVLFFRLIDLLRGQYKFKVTITLKNEKIVEFALPTDMINLKLGLKKDDKDDFSNIF